MSSVGSSLSSVFICSDTDKEQVKSERQDESARTNDAMSCDVAELRRELSELKTENEALRTKVHHWLELLLYLQYIRLQSVEHWYKCN